MTSRDPNTAFDPGTRDPDTWVDETQHQRLENTCGGQPARLATEHQQHPGRRGPTKIGAFRSFNLSTGDVRGSA
jgi:hypothetical protein